MISITLGVVLFLLGASLTGFVARRSRRRPLLQYTMDFDVLVNPLDNLGQGGLDLELNGHSVKSISRTYVAIWNQNGDPLRRTDVVDSDPLRVVFAAGDSPLQARVTFRSRPQTSIDCRIVDNAVIVDFAFLDVGDGGVLEILHQGAIPTVTGTVVGAVLRKRTDANLTPRALLWMRETSWRKRLLGRMRSGHMTKATTMPLVLLSLVTAGFTATEWVWHRHPRLVNSAHYHLASLRGQADFAAKVQRVGQLNTLSVVAYGLPLIVTLGTLSFYVLGAKRSVPRGIVAEQLDPSAQAGEGK